MKESNVTTLTGNGENERVKSDRTGKRSMRRKCWNCKRYGHFAKDCRNVAALTDENREAYDDRTEYCSKDWQKLD